MGERSKKNNKRTRVQRERGKQRLRQTPDYYLKAVTLLNETWYSRVFEKLSEKMRDFCQ